MHRLLSALALVVSLGGPATRPGAQEQGVVYAALPIRNLTASPGASDELRALTLLSLEERGAILVPWEAMDAALRSRRIRYTDSVSRGDARAIGELTGARYLLAGALLTHVPGPDPGIAVALRVIDVQTGRRVQSTLVSLRGEDFRGMLGIGMITTSEELEREVVARVLEDFDERGAPRALTSEGGLSGARPSNKLSLFIADDFDPSSMTRLAILPLVNRTNRPDAGLTFAEILGHQWSRAAGIEVVEQSELRAAMIRERLRSLDFLSLEVFGRLGQDLGTRYFMVGSIDRYVEEVFVEGGRYPEVEASIRILDVSSGRIMAGASVRRRGDDYHVMLGLGSVRNLVSLAERVALELVALIGD